VPKFSFGSKGSPMPSAGNEISSTRSLQEGCTAGAAFERRLAAIRNGTARDALM
jgi:hypothetical protein